MFKCEVPDCPGRAGISIADDSGPLQSTANHNDHPRDASLHKQLEVHVALKETSEAMHAFRSVKSGEIVKAIVERFADRCQ